MDFFEHQERARRSSHLLIVYFALAVAGTILAIYGLAVAVSLFMGTDEMFKAGRAFRFWNPNLLAFTSLGSGGAIFLASAYKSMQLAGGGRVVARELGGRRLDARTTDFHERRLLNVVEEMAIAAGIPVPEVYVMDGEDSINAFAAGKSTSDAVVGVTRGCLKLLTRDELQGVVAHEFSHILNGDMRLNMRLMALLFGILFLTLIGESIVRGLYYSSGRSRNSRDSGGIVLALFLAGIGLILIGYVGSFFAGLIKASISRQREYLADASAVQFTRNPDGIGGALKKIGAVAEGSRIAHPMARDASHLFFGSAFSHQLFATHPPLHERIRRLLPQWNGDFGRAQLAPVTASEDSAPPAANAGGTVKFFGGDGSPVRLSGEEAAESMRSLHPEQVSLGRDLLQTMPEHWLAATREESGAQAIVFALLLAQDGVLREQEVRYLRQSAGALISGEAERFFREMQGLHSAVKLALIDLCIPVLRQMSPQGYEKFRGMMEAVAASDQRINLFEFTLQKVVARHLDHFYGSVPTPRIRYHELKQLREEAAVLVSTLAAFTAGSHPGRVEASFESGRAHLEDAGSGIIEFKGPEECGLAQVRAAIEKFGEATPVIKRELLLACSKAVLSDGSISSREAELIRAIADAIGAAIPPFVRTAPVEDFD